VNARIHALFEAAGFTRHRLAGDPLRLRHVWSRTRPPLLRPNDVSAQLTEALAS
jgi:hypothetical protein